MQLKVDLEKEQATHTTQVNDKWIERSKELETIIHNNNTEIHSLNNECAQLKQQLHFPSNIIEGTDDKKANDEWTERIKELETITVQAVRNITLISQKRTKTKSCEFVRTFSKISEFAN